MMWDGRMAEEDTHRRVVKLAAQLAHLIDEKFQTLDLDIRSGEAVNDGAVLILRARTVRVQQADDFTIADELPRILDCPGFRGIEQRADDDGRTGQAAHAADERGVCALSRRGAPPRRISSFGNRSLARPYSASRSCQTDSRLTVACEKSCVRVSIAKNLHEPRGLGEDRIRIRHSESVPNFRNSKYTPINPTPA